MRCCALIENLQQRTRENWTYGMLSIPLLYGHNNSNGVIPKTWIRRVNDKARIYSEPYYALDKSRRYFWYELDSLANMFDVLQTYANMKIDVYWHKTFNGIHFISLHTMPVDEWDTLLDSMNKQFNPSFVKYALRIVPNKWIGESDTWLFGHIVNNGSGHLKQLQYIQCAIESPYVFNYNRTIPTCIQMLQNTFAISRYPFKPRLQV